ncbi:MFS transporter [Streptomyces bauhiniae]|uniref:MFS transporter n=1 Tax=Streptomyces bauhiniae TaxID=2340725 RepID=UPI00332A8270
MRGAGVLLVAAFAVAMAQTVVVAALAVFGRELGVSATGAAWLLTAFMLASAVATPVAGRLGDLFGHRRVLLAGLGLLLAGSVVAGVGTLSGSYPGVVAGRVLQGLSGGVFPCAFGLARRTVPAERLRGVVAALSTMFGVGGAAGMVVAGPLVSALGTAGLFWTVGALGAVALAGVGLSTGAPSARTGGGRVDVLGALLLAGALVALLLGISQGRAWGWGSAGILGLFGAAVGCAAGFGVVERRVAAPVVDLRLLVGRRLFAVNVATLVVSAGMFAAVTLIPLLAQAPPARGYGFGYSPARTGLLMLPMACCMLLAVRWAGVLGARATFRLGAVLGAVALAGLGLLHTHPAELLCWGALLGLAYGLAFASLGGLVVGAVAEEQTGAATGINTILRTVGGAIGSVVAATLLAASGYTTAFLVAGAIAGCAAVVVA